MMTGFTAVLSGPGRVECARALNDAERHLPALTQKPRVSLWPSLDESSDGMTKKVLATTTQAEHGGRLLLYNGETMAW